MIYCLYGFYSKLESTDLALPVTYQVALLSIVKKNFSSNLLTDAFLQCQGLNIISVQSENGHN